MQHPVVSREKWLAARADLLQAEKRLTQERARVAELRRALPWVKVEKQYTLVNADGNHALSDLFLDRSQLAVYHLMFGPGRVKPCTGCTQWANALNGTTDSFKAADARLICVSSAPYAEITPQKTRLKWTFDWFSSASSDFNRDFYGSSEDRSELSTKEVGVEQVTFDRGENHGVSVFYKNESGDIFHTYSAFNRGIEELNGALGYYDLLPKGRAW